MNISNEKWKELYIQARAYRDYVMALQKPSPNPGVLPTPHRVDGAKIDKTNHHLRKLVGKK